MQATSFLSALLASSLLLSVPFSHAEGMKVSSSSFSENGTIPALHGGHTGDCGGQGVSPQIGWANLPAATKSVALLAFDPDGARGLGVSHWVAYNIAAARGQLKEGEAQADAAGFTQGKNVAGQAAYRGMCPPTGDVAHHYVFTVIATDLEPGVLPAGLNREELLVALKGHALGGHSTVGYYAR